LGAPVAPVVQVQATAASGDGTARANQVQVLGVDDRFWKLAGHPAGLSSAAADEVILNQPLAEQLGAKVGDSILLRVEKPSLLSREAPISPQEDFALALRARVGGIVGESQLGRFSLQASQVPPFNAFVPLASLSERLEMPGRANLLLVPQRTRETTLTPDDALRQTWQLADAELELRPVPNNGGLELRTRRVFLDPAAAAAGMAAGSNTAGVLTYFVNELRLADRDTPYSMVTAMGAPVVPAEMRDDEILVNQWLSDDLGAKPGDTLSLVYYVIATARKLEERTNHFTVRAVVPMEGAAADRTLMPDFPGLDKAESTHDWDTSLPIHLERVRPKDEAYWKEHRGTPKAFVTLAAGQAMWTNRFGNLTAVRYAPGTDAAEVSQRILRTLTPAAVGLSFQPVRQQALAASDQAQDFGQLFLGFSFFLIIAALLLTALLFQFGIEKRATEIGTLLALGFTPKLVRRLFLGEGAILAALGALVGVPGGIAYAQAMLYGLSTLWRSAVGTSALRYHATSQTLVIGGVSGLMVAIVTLWLALRRQARQPARELLAEGGDTERRLPAGRSSRGIWIGWLASALAVLMIGLAGMRQQTADPEVFFMAGTLLLISGLGFAAALLSALASSDTAAQPALGSMGLRNATRRRRRSLATIGLLACGSFLVAAIGVFKLESNDAVRKRSSGTGGFGLIGESTLPLVHDLNTEQGRQFFGLGANDLPGVRVVPMRVRDGEDASCLNLNRAQRPRLLGVRAELLNERHAFTFARIAPGHDADSPWLLLNAREPDGAIPAIGDAASIQWALGKKVGDTLDYTDDRGREFKVRLVGALANSILQGSLLIGENPFLDRFPSESGYRMFLIDVQPHEPNHMSTVAATLSRATQDYGMQLTPAARRLAAFNAVQNTYLNTFQVLGGLGLLLGSIGLGVVVLRNVLERRGELALLLAVGFRLRSLKWLVLSEHGALLLIGLLIGTVAAFVAVLPTLLMPGVNLPVRSLCWTLSAVLASGALWTWAATWLALRGGMLNALRNE
jgi:ABC-type lipoprotein release transport system permease subunit